MEFRFYRFDDIKLYVDIWTNGGYTPDAEDVLHSIYTYKTLSIRIYKYMLVIDYSHQKIRDYKKVV